MDVLEVDGPWALSHSVFAADVEGGTVPIEMESWYVNRVEEDGRVAETRFFSDEDAARGWWREHAAGGAAVEKRIARAFNARDLPALEACLAPELTWNDVRGGVRDSAGDRTAFLDAVRDMTDGSDVRLDMEVLEEGRGCSLVHVLYRGTYRGGPFEAPMTAVHTTDEQGRVLTVRTFAKEDERSAREWFRHARQVAGLQQAWTNHDLDAIAAELHDDFVFDDARPTAGGPADRQGFLDTAAELFRLTPDIRQHQELTAVAGDRRITRITWDGHIAPGGGAMQTVFHALGTLRGARLGAMELHATEEEALAALRSTPESSGARGSPAAQGFAVLERAFNEADWEAVATILREDYRWIDHRPGLRMETRTREEFVALLRQAREGKDLQWHQTWFEERAGGRVGLARVVQRGRYRGGPYGFRTSPSA